MDARKPWHSYTSILLKWSEIKGVNPPFIPTKTMECGHREWSTSCKSNPHLHGRKNSNQSISKMASKFMKAQQNQFTYNF